TVRAVISGHGSPLQPTPPHPPRPPWRTPEHRQPGAWSSTLPPCSFSRKPIPVLPFPLPTSALDPATASGDNGREEVRPMTEAEWLAGHETPAKMMRSLREQFWKVPRPERSRKLRLFALSCYQRLLNVMRDDCTPALRGMAEKVTDSFARKIDGLRI